MSFVYVGIDAGRSDTAVVLRRGDKLEVETFPSMVGSGDAAQLIQQRQAMGMNGLEPDEYVLALDGRENFVGRLALEQSRDATSAPGDDSRYFNGHVRRLAATGIARLIERKAISNGATIRGITGVPVRVWSPDVRARIQRSLVGDYRVTWKGRPIAFTIDALGVAQECAVVNYDLADEPVPVASLDIGGGTVDWHWSVQRRPVNERCHQERDMGVWKIATLIRQKARALPNGRDLSDHEVRLVIDAYARGKSLPPLRSRGEVLHLNGEIASAVDEVGELVAGRTRDLWQERGGIAVSTARVKLIGGGAYFLREHIQAVIPEVVVPSRPELENAVSFLAMAQIATEDAWARSRG